MKALSIKQPWASLICASREDNPALGIKDIENRTWKTNFRGRIYIHASTNSSAELSRLQFDEMMSEENIDLAWKIKEGEIPIRAIIGEVDIIDCVINHESIWAEKMKFDVCPDTGIHILQKGQPYIWNWVLANPVLYEKPIPAKGKLSFWEPDAQTLELIKDR